MTLHPAQERALAYLRRKGTEAPAKAVWARVAGTFSKLEERLREIGPEEATRKPDPATWCVQEVVDHLTVSLGPAVAALRALLAGEPPGEAIPAGLLGSDALERSWPEAVARLEAAHRRFLEALAAGDDNLPLDRTAPAVLLIKVEGEHGELEPLEWTEQLDWKSLALIAHVHTLEHVDQIRRILERIQGGD